MKRESNMQITISIISQVIIGMAMVISIPIAFAP